MSTQVQFRRGTSADHAAFTGAQGEVTVNTTTGRLHVHDGITPGGQPTALIADLMVGLVRTDIAQGLSSAAQLQARANIGVVANTGTRNRHLNSAFQICQDRAFGSSIAISLSTYAFDGTVVLAGGGGVLTCAQIAKLTPGGSPFRFRAAVTTVDTSLTSTDNYGVEFPVEGINVSDFMFGTALARSFTWRAIVNFPAGTYGLSFRNNDVTRSYVTTFTISAGQAGVDTLITAVVPGDTEGTWVKDSSGTGISACIAFAISSPFQTSTTGMWQSGNFVATPAQTNGMSSPSNVFEVADIGMYAGTELPTWVMPSYLSDYFECLRLYETSFCIANSTEYLVYHYIVPKRSIPSISISGNTMPVTSGPTGQLGNFSIVFTGTTAFNSASSCRL